MGVHFYVGVLIAPHFSVSRRTIAKGGRGEEKRSWTFYRLLPVEPNNKSTSKSFVCLVM
jgi:hypothetical protein